MRDLTGRQPKVVADPMSLVGGLPFVGMAGIIDPLRPAIDAVRTGMTAGIEVRMITGDRADHRRGHRRRARHGSRGDPRHRDRRDE